MLIRRAMLWSGIEAVAGGALSLASAFIIARMIGPDAVGIGAAAVATHVVFWVAVNGLFADALVQRSDLTERMIASAIWSGLAIGVLGLIGQGLAGLLLAWQLGDPRLTMMGLALAATLPLIGLGGSAQGLLTRRGAYRALALRTILGQGAGVTVGIASAMAGDGAWALVWQQVATTSLGAVVLLVAERRLPRLSWHWADARALLGIGLPLIASTLTQIGRYRIFAILIGALAGPAVLGQAHMAFRLVDTVRDLIFTALWRLLLPDLSRFQHDRVAMLARVDRLLLLCCGLIFPVCVVLAFALPVLAGFALGPAWAEAGSAALPLTALMALMAVTFPSGVALIALGQARFTLYGNLAALVLSVLAAWLLRPATAWDCVMVWCLSQAAIVPYALWVNGRALGVGVWRVVRGGEVTRSWRVPGVRGT